MNEQINRIICGDALQELKRIESESIALAVTSPPYWNLIDYDMEGQYGQCTYDMYLDQMLNVFAETERILRPNGKLAIVTPIVPVSKSIDDSTHTRKLANISNDIEFRILGSPKTKLLHRYSLYIWQKQTSKKMFGSYPYPPNIYEDNTIEFINVFVKDGKPPKMLKEVKERSKISQEEWLNLSMQVWPIMPSDVQRTKGHPAPFPTEIPKRLMAMYSFKEVPELDFEGDVILDMFNGSGSTTLAAYQMGRRYIGIDLNIEYCRMAEKRINTVQLNGTPNLIIDRIKMPTKNNKKEIRQNPVGLFD